MKIQSVLGIILIIIGVLILIYQGITYTKREQVLKVGPLQVTGEKQETVPISPIIGVISLAGGIFLVVLGSNRKV